MKPTLSLRRVPPRRSRQRGFSLIELVAAFVVFALAFGVLMGILSSSIRNTRLAAEYTQAALWAQSRLDVVGIGEKLEEGHESGRFDDEYRWELDISKYEPPPMPVECGSTTQRTAQAAMAASIALPPWRRMSMAVSVAAGIEVAAMPHVA